MSTVDATKYTVNDARAGITNREYLLNLLEDMGSKPAKHFLYDDVKDCEDIDLIAYFVIMVKELEDDTIMSIAKKISFKDFLFVVVNLVEQHYLSDEYCSKYETNIEKLSMELYVLGMRLNYQRLNKPLFKELCSVNYDTFHDTMYDLIAEHSPGEDKELIAELRSAGQQNPAKEWTLGEFFSYVNRTMNQYWCPTCNIRDYKNAVLNGHRLFLKEIILPLAFGMNADVMSSQTFEDIVKKYS